MISRLASQVSNRRLCCFNSTTTQFLVTSLLIGCLSVLAQTSSVSSVTKAPGDPVTLDIAAHSQPDGAPVALKWEVVFPSQLLAMEGDAPELGGAAKLSGKSLQCAAKAPYRYLCVLSGGPNPIANGPIAIFHFRIQNTAEGRTIALRIERAEATTVDSRALPLNDTSAIVVIRATPTQARETP